MALGLGLKGLSFSNSNRESMLPTGAESKHTAIPAHACVQTGKPKQEKRKEVVGIQEEGQDYFQEREKEKNQAGLLGGVRITDLYLWFIV